MQHIELVVTLSALIGKSAYFGKRRGRYWQIKKYWTNPLGEEDLPPRKVVFLLKLIPSDTEEREQRKMVHVDFSQIDAVAHMDDLVVIIRFKGSRLRIICPFVPLDDSSCFAE